jgi:cell division protein FtsX
MPQPRSDQDFPNAGTDRRPDELERNLHTEAEAVASQARAVETDRVADEDRENADQRAGALERLVNVLAAAVFVLLIMVILLGVALAISLT